jgi:uncharacterized RDD family membrane protein YckC
MATAIRTGAVGIVTAEAVLLELEVADYGSRLSARLIDLLIQATAFLVLAVGLGFVNSVLGGFGETVSIIVVIVATFGIVFVYPTATETLGRGQSPGKKAIGLRVMTIEGGPVRFRHSAIRAAVAIVDVWPGGMLASVSMLLDSRCRRLGDLAAGTIVIRERGASDAVGAVWFPAPPGWESYVDALPVGLLTGEHYELVRNFLLRASTLTLAARANLAIQIADRVGRRMGVQPVGPTEVWLAAVAASWQRQKLR